MTDYANGWVEQRVEKMSGSYWLDGFPPSDDEQERMLRGRGPDLRQSPIYDYRDGGIGKIEWMNTSLDKAAILAADGGWKVGGTFHLWVSEGAGTRPREVEWADPPRIIAGDPSGWIEVKQRAAQMAREYLGLRELS